MLISAIDRVGEKTFAGVFQKHLEKVFGRRIAQRDVAFLEAVQDTVSDPGVELAEIFLECALTVLVDVANTGALQLSWSEL